MDKYNTHEITVIQLMLEDTQLLMLCFDISCVDMLTFIHCHSFNHQVVRTGGHSRTGVVGSSDIYHSIRINI